MKQILKNTKGITLIALVITIVVLIILAGVAINLSIGENGIFNRAKQSRDDYMLAANEEQAMMANIDLNSIMNKSTTPPADNPTTTEKLSASNYDKVKTKYLGNELIAVDYEPETVSATVTVDGTNNGGLADQTFTQADVGAKGDNKVSWYVLSVSDSEVKLVSSVSKKKVQFKNSSGYDNCLYYLNDITTTLFKNDSLGVTSNRVHALRLTDIRDAATSLNGSSYNWDTTFVNGATNKSAGVTNIGDSKEYTNTGYTYHPKIYTASGTTVTANNPLYDETPGSKITGDSGIKRTETGNPASSLTVNGTYFGYTNSTRDTMITNLSTFGTTGIAKELFNSSGTNFWLASRCVNAGSDNAYFRLRLVYSGLLYYGDLCYSGGDVGNPSYAFRAVVSVPGSRVNVATDGAITIQ